MSSCKPFDQDSGIHENMGDDYFCYHDDSQTVFISPIPHPPCLLTIWDCWQPRVLQHSWILLPSALRMPPECDFPKPCSLDFFFLLIFSSFQNMLTLLKALSLDFSQPRHPFSGFQMCILPQFPRILSTLHCHSFSFYHLSSSLSFSSSLPSLHLEVQIQFPAACYASPSNIPVAQRGKFGSFQVRGALVSHTHLSCLPWERFH